MDSGSEGGPDGRLRGVIALTSSGLFDCSHLSAGPGIQPRTPPGSELPRMRRILHPED